MSKIASSRGRYCRAVRRHRGKIVYSASIPLALIASPLLTVPAQAATVNALQGQVLVNSGQGYRLVDGSTSLGPGGTVVANPGAIARVVYSGGCGVTVQPGSVYLVAARPPCETEDTAAAGGVPDSGGTATGSGTSWALGAAAIGAGGAAAYFLLKPASASP